MAAKAQVTIVALAATSVEVATEHLENKMTQFLYR